MKMSSMVGPERPSLALQATSFVLAVLAVGLATLAGQLIAARWGTASVVLLYLMPVLGSAIFGGWRQSLVTALVATLAYNYFFTEPLHSLMISGAADVVTVVVLFLAGIVTSSLAGSLRQQTRLVSAHASRNATIAGFAGRLLSTSEEDAIYKVTAEELAQLFDCHSAIAVGEGDIRVAASAPGPVGLSPADLAAAAHAIATGEPAGRGVKRAANTADWQFRAIRGADGIAVAVGLAREDGAPPVGAGQSALIENLLDQAALALARATAEREAREFAALRERDGMRDALLASIGQDVKPSLNAIGAGVRALRRAETTDRAAVSAVAAETVKLERYIDNLLDVGPGANRDPIVVRDVAIDLYRRIVTKRDQPVHVTPKEYAVLAELAKHTGRVLTHAQLLRSVWGPAHEHQIDYLRVAIGALRRKLEDQPAEPRLILNEPAVGYRLAV